MSSQWECLTSVGFNFLGTRPAEPLSMAVQPLPHPRPKGCRLKLGTLFVMAALVGQALQVCRRVDGGLCQRGDGHGSFTPSGT